jgi:hypothetical protein
MKTCLTRKLLNSEVSGCLVEKPECGNAIPFGFSYLCGHPDHAKFRADISGSLTIDEINGLYDALRQKRRDEFMSNLDDPGRELFCRTDFFGRLT